MAHKKAGGSTKNGRDSESKDLESRNMVASSFKLATLY